MLRNLIRELEVNGVFENEQAGVIDTATVQRATEVLGSGALDQALQQLCARDVQARHARKND